MKYDLIGGERDGQVLCVTYEAERFDLAKMPAPCVTLGGWSREPDSLAMHADTYTLRVFDFCGQQYKCYALSVLTDLQARNIAIKRVMA